MNRWPNFPCLLVGGIDLAAEANGGDGTSTTDGLSDVSEDGFTEDGSDLGVDCTTSGISLVETLTRDRETWIGIPGGVREVFG